MKRMLTTLIAGKYRKITSIVLIMLGFFLPVANSQNPKVEILPSTIQALPGNYVNVPIVVTGFNTASTSVAAIEFYIDFNNVVLTYIEPVNFSSLLPKDQWFYSNPSPTLTRFACNWAEPGLQNVMIPDGTVLFEIKFLYNGGESVLDFVEENSLFVHIDENYNLVQLTVQYINGLVTFSTIGFETTWNGVGSWNDGSFWSNGVPTPNSIAVIESGEVTIQTGIASVKMLTIKASTTVKILPNVGLTVDSLLVNNGLIWLVSDSTGCGSLIVHHQITGNGDYRMERYLKNGFHTIGAPVAGTNSNVFQNAILRRWDEPTGQFINLPPASPLLSGVGYLSETTTDATFVFESKNIHQGNFNLPVSFTPSSSISSSGYNLVSNPFPSAVVWTGNNWQLNNTGNAIYIWDTYRYRVWNGTIGNITNGIIPAMQGFIIKTFAGNPAVTIPNSARIHSNQPFYKESNTTDNLLLIEFGKFINNTLGPAEDVVFYQVLQGATADFDPAYDAYKLPNAPGILTAFSCLDNPTEDRMVIDVRGWEGNHIPSVYLGFIPPAPGSYYLRLSNTSSFAPSTPFVLEDKMITSPFPGNQIDMRTGVLNFTYIFQSAPGDPEKRFILHFSPVGINEQVPGKQLKIYTSGNTLMIVNNSQIREDAVLELYDISGKIVFSVHCTLDTITEIPLPKVTPGIYLVRLTSYNLFLTEKLFLKP